MLCESVFSQAFITIFIYYTKIELAKRIFEIFLVGRFVLLYYHDGYDDDHIEI